MQNLLTLLENITKAKHQQERNYIPYQKLKPASEGALVTKTTLIQGGELKKGWKAVKGCKKGFILK